MVRRRQIMRLEPMGFQAVFLLAALLLGGILAWLPLPLAMGVVVGTAVVLLTLIQPTFGLLLALLVGPWGALENVLRGPSLLDSGQLLLLLTLVAWLARGLAYRRIVVPRTWLNIPFALLIFTTALSLLGAVSLVAGLRELLKWLEMAAVMLLVVDVVGQWRNGRTGLRVAERQVTGLYGVLVMLLLAGLSQALMGIWQFGLRQDGPEHFLILGRFYRAYGTFEQPNPFAGFVNLSAMLAVGVLLGMAAWLWGQRWNLRRVLTRRFVLLVLFVGGTAVACVLAVIMSWSRGAWLSMAAGAAAMLLFWPRKLWQGAALLLLGGLLLWGGVQTGLLPASITERLTSFGADLRFGDVRGVDINDANYAVLERLAHWQAALDMARDEVWLGVGFGNYEPAYADYALINWPYPLGHAHNYYLNLLAETGVLGLLAYGLFWTAVFWQTIHLLRTLKGPERGIALGLLGAWTGLAAHHLVDKLYVNNIYVHLGVMLGLLQLLALQRVSADSYEHRESV